MKAQTLRVLRYLRDRLSEPSTWRGITLLLTVAGAKINPQQTEAIVLVGLGVAGFIGAIFPDQK